MTDVAYPCKHGGQVFCGSCETGDLVAANAQRLHRVYSDALDGLDDWGTLTDLDREAWIAVARATAGLGKPQ